MKDVMMISKCQRIDFDGEEFATREEISDCHIAVSAEKNTFSIRDMDSGVMLVVSLDYAMETIARALDQVKVDDLDGSGVME